MKRLLGALLVAASITLIIPAVATAHAGFVSSDPEPGAELGSAPGVVVLEFSEQINEQLSRAQVLAPDGTSFKESASGPRSIEIALTTNLRGIYDVEWTTVSRVDGHTLHGSFQFGVGVQPKSGAEGIVEDEPGFPDLVVGVGRAVEDLALFLATGALLLRALGRRRPTLPWVRVRLAPFLVIAASAGAAVVIGEALLAAPSPSWSGIATYLTSGSTGVVRSLRPVVEASAVLALASPRIVAFIIAASLGLLAAAGHAAVVEPPGLGIVIETMHLWSAACWAGGILALSRLHPPGGWLHGDGRPLLERFTPVALITFGVTAVTGVLRGVQEVGGLGSLFTSLYGWTLIAKVLAIGLMVEFSFLAWRRIAAWPRLEATFAVAAIAAAALLASFPLPPARSDEAEQEAAAEGGLAGLPGAEALTLGGHAGQLLVGLSIAPGEPGENAITLFLLPLGGDAAAARIAATLEVDGRELTLTQCGATCREGTVDLDGGERLTVRVPGDEAGAAVFELPDLPAPDGRGVVERMLDRMHALQTYRLEETLSSGGPSVVTQYAFQAPDRAEARTLSSDGITHVVWIGTTQYLRTPGNEWSVSKGGPGQEVPSFIWDYFQPFRDIREIGKESVEGVKTSVVTFFSGGDTTPVWFGLWIDPDGLVRRAEMRAQGHFMDHRYFAFDAPVKIEEPKGAGG